MSRKEQTTETNWDPKTKETSEQSTRVARQSGCVPSDTLVVPAACTTRVAAPRVGAVRTEPRPGQRTAPANVYHGFILWVSSGGGGDLVYRPLFKDYNTYDKGGVMATRMTETQVVSFWNSLSLSHTHTHSLSHTHTRTHTHAHTHTYTHSLSFSLLHTRILSLSLSLSLSFSHSLSLSHTDTDSLSLSLSPGIRTSSHFCSLPPRPHAPWPPTPPTLSAPISSLVPLLALPVPTCFLVPFYLAPTSHAT